MSLILEALKKLEREKQTADRGFLVLAPASWPARARSRSGAAIAALAIALMAATAVLLWRSQAGALQVAAPTPAGAALPVRAPSPAAALFPAPAPPPSYAPASPLAAAPSSLAAPEPALEQPRRAPTRPDAATLASAPAAGTEGPLRRPPALASSAPEYQLQAISQRDGRPVAVLNDRMVYEGDSFDGVRIVRIGESEVEIEVEGRRMIVRF